MQSMCLTLQGLSNGVIASLKSLLFRIWFEDRVLTWREAQEWALNKVSEMSDYRTHT